MALTHPDKIANSLDLLGWKTIPALISEYRHAWQYRLDRKDRPALTDAEREVSTQVSHEHGGLASDPTGETVMEQAHVRNVLETVDRLVKEAINDLESSVGRLVGVFQSDDDYAPLQQYAIRSDAEKQSARQASSYQRKRAIEEEIERHQRSIVELRRQLTKVA